MPPPGAGHYRYARFGGGQSPGRPGLRVRGLGLHRLVENPRRGTSISRPAFFGGGLRPGRPSTPWPRQPPRNSASHRGSRGRATPDWAAGRSVSHHAPVRGAPAITIEVSNWPAWQAPLLNSSLRGRAHGLVASREMRPPARPRADRVDGRLQRSEVGRIQMRVGDGQHPEAMARRGCGRCRAPSPRLSPGEGSVRRSPGRKRRRCSSAAEGPSPAGRAPRPRGARARHRRAIPSVSERQVRACASTGPTGRMAARVGAGGVPRLLPGHCGQRLHGYCVLSHGDPPRWSTIPRALHDF